MKEDKRSLVEKHALNRLDKVEQEKRKVYRKRPNKANFVKIFFSIITLLVIIVMLISTFGL